MPSSSRDRLTPAAISFFEHPFVKNKLCKRRPGLGFECQGRRLMGITEYLRRNFYPHFQATRRGKTNAKFRGLGLRMGSIADSAVTAYAKTGNSRKMASCPNAIRLVNYLRSLQLSIVDAHVLVADPRIGIATEIDILAENHMGLVVVENKTTLQTRADHEQTYKKPDKDCPLLLKSYTSLLNNEYNHHQLQLAYMLTMLKNTYNIHAHGIVLMASSDGLNQYPMDTSILNMVRQNVMLRTVMMPITILPTCPLIHYRFRSLILPKSSTNVDNCFIFLQKLDAVLNFDIEIGKLSFYERPDLIISKFVDVVAENSSQKHFFLIRPIKSLTQLKEIVQFEKLPTGKDATFAAKAFFELALAVLAAGKSSKPILAKIIFILPSKKIIVKKLPAIYLKALKQ